MKQNARERNELVGGDEVIGIEKGGEFIEKTIIYGRCN